MVITSTQTQPGLPATSSPDAELRGISRACVLDFGLEVEVEVPRISSDSSASITAAKRIGAGNQAPPRGRFGVLRPRGSLVSASREGPAEKGTLRNPNLVAGATASERHSVKLVRENPPSQWKPVFPISPSVAIANATLAQQIHGVRAQPREEELIRWALQATMLLGGARGGTLGADKRAQGRS